MRSNNVPLPSTERRGSNRMRTRRTIETDVDMNVSRTYVDGRLKIRLLQYRHDASENIRRTPRRRPIVVFDTQQSTIAHPCVWILMMTSFLHIGMNKIVQKDHFGRFERIIACKVHAQRDRFVFVQRILGSCEGEPA